MLAEMDLPQGGSKFRDGTLKDLGLTKQRSHRYQLVAHVISANLKRRHLKTGQRSMVGDRVAGYSWGGDRTSSGKVTACSQSEAAKLLNVSESSVRKARKVRKKATPKVIKAAEDGDVSLHKAASGIPLAVTQGRPAETARIHAVSQREASKLLNVGRAAT
jgi:DNA-binding transcriptional regulator YdaS (Cro superfamily)